jgi:hypothetical protein
VIATIPAPPLFLGPGTDIYFAQRISPILRPCNLTAMTFGIRAHARLGNHFIQIIHCLVNAKILNVKQVVVPRGWFWITHHFATTDGVQFFVDDECQPRNVITRYWFAYPTQWPISRGQALSSVKDQLLQFVPRASVPPDLLVMHVRSEDNFFPSNTGRIWQPPCFFYTSVRAQYKDAIMITTDNANPCVDVLLAMNVTWVKRSRDEDIAKLIWARNVAMSTFAQAAVLLSPVLRNLYLFRDFQFMNVSEFNLRGVHQCAYSPKYAEAVKADFFFPNTPDAYRLIREENCTWWS